MLDLIKASNDLAFEALIKANLDAAIDWLEKGAGHKYLKRMLTGKVKPKYRYIYSVNSKYHGPRAGDPNIGDKIKAKHGEHHGHFEVTDVHFKDGKTSHVTIKHDESGHEKRVHVDHLHELFADEHKEAIKDTHGKLARVARQAHKTGTDKQRQRARDALRAFEERYELELEPTHGEQMTLGKYATKQALAQAEASMGVPEWKELRRLLKKTGAADPSHIDHAKYVRAGERLAEEKAKAKEKDRAKKLDTAKKRDKAAAPKNAAKNAAKLRAAADKLDGTAKEEIGRDRQTNTHKRQREAAHAIKNAMRDEQLAATMRNIADTVEAKYLSKVTSKAQVETLEAILAHANYKRLSEGVDYSTYVQRKGEKPTTETLKFAEHPLHRMDKHTLERLAKEAHIPEADKVRLRTMAAGLGKEGLKLNAAGRELVMRAAENFPRSGWDYKKELAGVVKRLAKLGIENTEDLRGALGELLEHRGGRREIDRTKQAEQKVALAKIPGYFPTPKGVVDRMVQIAGVKKGDRVLEPSAGAGHIADAIAAKGADVHAVEINSQLQDVLKLKGHNVVGTDALAHGQRYDHVIMNPPFEKGADMDHVRHAFEENLAAGGKVVAIMSEGAFFRSDKRATGFREWLESVGGTSEKLPAGTFKESDRQTGVATRLVTIEKKPAPAAKQEARAAELKEARARDQGEPRISDVLGDRKEGETFNQAKARMRKERGVAGPDYDADKTGHPALASAQATWDKAKTPKEKQAAAIGLRDHYASVGDDKNVRKWMAAHNKAMLEWEAEQKGDKTTRRKARLEAAKPEAARSVGAAAAKPAKTFEKVSKDAVRAYGFATKPGASKFERDYAVNRVTDAIDHPETNAKERAKLERWKTELQKVPDVNPGTDIDRHVRDYDEATWQGHRVAVTRRSTPTGPAFDARYHPPGATHSLLVRGDAARGDVQEAAAKHLRDIMAGEKEKAELGKKPGGLSSGEWSRLEHTNKRMGLGRSKIQELVKDVHAQFYAEGAPSRVGESQMAYGTPRHVTKYLRAKLKKQLSPSEFKRTVSGSTYPNVIADVAHERGKKEYAAAKEAAQAKKTAEFEAGPGRKAFEAASKQAHAASKAAEGADTPQQRRELHKRANELHAKARDLHFDRNSEAAREHGVLANKHYGESSSADFEISRVAQTEKLERALGPKGLERRGRQRKALDVKEANREDPAKSAKRLSEGKLKIPARQVKGYMPNGVMKARHQGDGSIWYTNGHMLVRDDHLDPKTKTAMEARWESGEGDRNNKHQFGAKGQAGEHGPDVRQVIPSSGKASIKYVYTGVTGKKGAGATKAPSAFYQSEDGKHHAVLDLGYKPPKTMWGPEPGHDKWSKHEVLGPLVDDPHNPKFVQMPMRLGQTQEQAKAIVDAGPVGHEVTEAVVPDRPLKVVKHDKLPKHVADALRTGERGIDAIVKDAHGQAVSKKGDHGPAWIPPAGTVLEGDHDGKEFWATPTGSHSTDTGDKGEPPAWVVVDEAGEKYRGEQQGKAASNLRDAMHKAGAMDMHGEYALDDKSLRAVFGLNGARFGSGDTAHGFNIGEYKPPSGKVKKSESSDSLDLVKAVRWAG